MPRYAKGSLERAIYQDIKLMAPASEKQRKMQRKTDAERRNSRNSRAHRMEVGQQQLERNAGAEKQHLIRVHARVLEMAAQLIEDNKISDRELIALLNEAAQDMRKLAE